jgi:hypothetical protein
VDREAPKEFRGTSRILSSTSSQKNRRCFHRPRTHWDNAKVRPYRVRGNTADNATGNKNSRNRAPKNGKNTAAKMASLQKDF